MRIEAISFVFSFFPPFFKKKEKKSYPRLICESFETTNPRRETHEHEIEKVTLSDGNLRNSIKKIRFYIYIYIILVEGSFKVSKASRGYRGQETTLAHFVNLVRGRYTRP